MGLVVSGADVYSVLQKQGFAAVSQKGSHVKMRRNELTVIVPLHDELKQGTLRSILRQANMSVKELKDLL